MHCSCCLPAQRFLPRLPLPTSPKRTLPTKVFKHQGTNLGVYSSSSPLNRICFLHFSSPEMLCSGGF
ncbi:hypothetical protein Cob_v007469 [Colletotrichum orbiculare MAFF 240422]|uniref:Uncharacterized protein n=1 Tax=Colletotrichum orbiculare (strain 104-T / ATCC 96160 / CBS 514.97 / LARS 414 / MAFF 240422) TaxID=1213857 RepID=A0A484FMS9_COLOR|nr:hypothetical protein Cob_v007469 [Colletotrichum orbiculare MAFF 240422]